MEKLDHLIARHREGFSLPQEFYVDREIYERDVERIHLRHWVCVGHLSRLPGRGDYFLFNCADESIIIVRTGENDIRALANVCVHRGSRVCDKSEGKARSFVCPYHGWGYNLDGTLRWARLTGDDFDLADYRLREFHVRIVEGTIFICCADDPPDFGDAERDFGNGIRSYGWANAKVAHRATYRVDANWKLVTENYKECYHCTPSHPEFSRCHATAKPVETTLEAVAEVHRRSAAMGISIPDVYHWPWPAKPEDECYHNHRDSLMPGCVSGSEDGQAVAPLMGEFTDYDGGFTYFGVGPSSFFLAYPDHGMMYLFLPRSVQVTEMEILWLVRDDAQEGEDYDRDRLTWMWDVTSIADKRIIDNNQKGVNSRFYVPGPYQKMEASISEFIVWYLEELRTGG